MITSTGNRLESIWGAPIMGKGFDGIPTLLTKNFRKVGGSHGEWTFICNLISFKHDERDPFPSRKTLAEGCACSERQIDKWIHSLKKKGLLHTYQHRSASTQKWGSTCYSLQPLIDCVLKYISGVPKSEIQEPCLPQVQEPCLPQVQEPCLPQVQEPFVPQVQEPFVPQVQEPFVPQVQTNQIRLINKINKDDDDRVSQILQNEFVPSLFLTQGEFDRIMHRVRDINPYNLLAYARKALLTAVQLKKKQEKIHKKKMEKEGADAHKRVSQKKNATGTYQRPILPIMRPEDMKGNRLTDEELAHAREVARKLDEGKIITHHNPAS